MARLIISEATKAKFDSVARPGETPDETLTRLIGGMSTAPKSYVPLKKVQKDEDED